VIRVGVLGAAGRMGRLVCRAVLDDRQLELVAAVSPSHGGERLGALIGEANATDVVVSADLGPDLDRAGMDVAVDLTRPDAVMENIHLLIEGAVHAVVGTSGVTAEDLGRIRGWLAAQEDGHRSNVVVVPNFAIGAVLMQRFAEMAAAHMPAAEIVELHHEGKLDAPSGTAVATARRIANARNRGGSAGSSGHDAGGARGAEVEGVPVHSVRLPGLVAHQEVIFGGAGQTLTIRHDSMDRVSFMPGVILSIKAVADRPGLTVGLEPLLGLDPSA
jgi:4-hydroxy-tetrahydrodipicolinate reductase